MLRNTLLALKPQRLVNALKTLLPQHWYHSSLTFFTRTLLPFSWLFAAFVASRHGLYQLGILRVRSFSAPVIVVGNITVGGTGKTPFVIWLVQFLRAQGYRPGIVSRGVGGKSHRQTYQVTVNSDVNDIGDEAALLFKRANCPLVVGKKRARAVQFLLQHTDCNIVISDDGLQHYQMDRALEIVIVDHARQFGNQRLLPAGPLREPLSRLKKVDFVVENGDKAPFHMTLEGNRLVSIKYPDQTVLLSELKSMRVNAVAGIGNPDRFFQALRAAGLKVSEHPFPDHYHYQAQDLDFHDAWPILMTEKDAVKCAGFANGQYWYLPVTAKLNVEFQKQLLQKLTMIGVVSHEKNDSRSISDDAIVPLPADASAINR